MNRNVKIGLIIVVVLVLLVGFWKVSAPKKVNNENKNLPPVPPSQGSQGSGTTTTPSLSEDGTSNLDADFLATTGTQDTNDAVITSSESLIVDEPA